VGVVDLGVVGLGYGKIGFWINLGLSPPLKRGAKGEPAETG
jgi:hypothetical protein